MSVFRIQHKKGDLDSKHKAHTEESRSYSKNAKNLTELLVAAQQKQKSKLQIKRRVFTIDQDYQGEPDHRRIKRISDAYNIGTFRNQSLKNSKISKKSFSGSKVIPIFSPHKNSQPKFHSGMIQSSPKIVGKLSGSFKTKSKQNANEQKLIIKSEKREFSTLNSSFLSRGNKNKIQTNRSKHEGSYDLFKEIYAEALSEYKKKNTEKAIKLFKECIRYEPQNIDCLYYLGSCYLNLKETLESLKYLNKLKSLSPSYNTNLYLYLAINNKMQSKHQQAIKNLLNGIKIFPDFEEGYQYLGKIYIKEALYNEAIDVLQKCVSLNEKNAISRLMLADAYSLNHNEQKAINLFESILKQPIEKFLDLKTKISTHLKLIKLLIQSQKYKEESLNQSLSFILQNQPTSPELSYYKSLIKYETQPQLNVKQLSQMKINLYFAFNELSTYFLTLDCARLLLKIYIDQKDFYGAQQLLKRVTQTQIKSYHLKEWILMIEGANDIIKRKIDEGKTKIQKCLQQLNQPPKQSSRRKQINLKVQSVDKDIMYLKFHALQFMGYVKFVEQNLSESLQFYQLLLPTNSSNFTFKAQLKFPHYKFDQTFIHKNRKKFSQIEINHLLIKSIFEHKVNFNFINAKKGFETVLQKRQNPQSLFLWIINQIALLKQSQTNYLSGHIDSLQPPNEPSRKQEEDSRKQFDWSSILQKAERAETLSPNFSLIFFYHSLIFLYLQSHHEALQKIELAIKKTDQPISEYHFIQALCYYAIYEQVRDIQIAYRGLDAIDKAIQIDSGIPEFYKERSKHLFCLGKYEDAVKDCQRSQSQQTLDEEAQLLSMFYHYAAGHYEESQKLLGSMVNPTSHKQEMNTSRQKHLSQSQVDYQEELAYSMNEHKYKQFEQALMFRLKKYQKTGILSKLFQSLTSQKFSKLDPRYIQMLNNMLQDRQQYSQFTVYFLNLLLATYCIYQKDFSGSLNYLFSCLEEIQCIVDEKNQNLQTRTEGNESKTDFNNRESKFTEQFNQIDTDAMLNEIKYNIVIATLTKNQKEREFRHREPKSIQQSYGETLNFIQTFISESQSEELCQNLQIIKNLIWRAEIQKSGIKSDEITGEKPRKQKNLTSSNDQLIRTIPIYLKPFSEQIKFSDQIPYLILPIGDNCMLMTKFLIFYPMKLRFNIKPEFDPSFLFNFDIDKVQNRITPPWYKFSSVETKGQLQNRIIFTDQFRNESIALSITERQPSILGNHHKMSKNRYQEQIHYVKASDKKIAGSQDQRQMEQQDKWEKKQKNSKSNEVRDFVRLDTKLQKKLKKLFPKLQMIS